MASILVLIESSRSPAPPCDRNYRHPHICGSWNRGKWNRTPLDRADNPNLEAHFSPTGSLIKKLVSHFHPRFLIFRLSYQSSKLDNDMPWF